MRQPVLLIALLALVLPLYGQTPDVEIADTVSVNYVMIPFTALGANGVPITDLRQRDEAGRDEEGFHASRKL